MGDTIVDAAQPARAGGGRPVGWREEASATLQLAWPLILAQLATIAIASTDVLMIGWLGPQQLAAGNLAYSLYFPFLIFGLGVTTAAAPMIARAIGAADPVSVRRTTRQGFWIAAILGAVLFLAMGFGETVLLSIGQEPALAAAAQGYLDIARFLFPAAMLDFTLRHLLAAHGRSRVVLAATLVAAVVNATLNYGLIFGHWGLPEMGLRGAAVASVAVHATQAAILFWIVTRAPEFKKYELFVRFFRPDWPRFWKMWRFGLPIGLTFLAETGLFSFASFMVGWLGAVALAGHAVALQLAAIAFMVPLGLSQATTIRVGLAFGRGDRVGAARAATVSLLLALAFMSSTAALFLLAPELLISAFLDPDDPRNAAAREAAAMFLVVAALFQLVDGAQVVGGAALRGLSDMTAPAVIAVLGYWAAGAPISYFFGHGVGWGGVGVWLGLAAGLGVAAVVMNVRLQLLLSPERFAARAARA